MYFASLVSQRLQKLDYAAILNGEGGEIEQYSDFSFITTLYVQNKSTIKVLFNKDIHSWDVNY